MSIAEPHQKKRLILCCDGTWMNSDKGFEKGKPQTPSNVTRMSRSFKRGCSDGTVQIIQYQSGVGTGSTLGDVFSGGAFGVGVAEHMREAYSFICANYVDGDEIVLLGFSRGAFTARSIAGMIGDLGLLTREGMEFFYPIFKDMQNWRTPRYRDPFPGVPFAGKPAGANAEETYRQMLLDRAYTRVREGAGAGRLITVKAVAVYDTVGSLGVPAVPWMEWLGIAHTTTEYRCYDTALSDRIEHAFHALALDEHRPPFSPTVWERPASNGKATDLRQVWFPGNHGNVGGGWPDQGVSNITMAWMMDQLTSVGVEFDPGSVVRLFQETERYYRQHPLADKIPAKEAKAANLDRHVKTKKRTPEILTKMVDAPKDLIARAQPAIRWAVDPICTNNHPIRPWSLGAIQKASSPLYTLTGEIVRTPGLYKRPNEFDGRPTSEYLEDTNEMVHASARIRLRTVGLGLNDRKAWDCPALVGQGWKPLRQADGKWVWMYMGEADVPKKVMEEAEMGHYEKRLLELAGGHPNVLEFAEAMVSV